jgi:hypothetical protein
MMDEGMQEAALAFNLSSWFLRRKIDAEVRLSGRPVEHRRIGNPYHAVSIDTGMRCCAEARAQEGRRYLSSAAPNLPLKGCTSASCQCRYVHHEDRRSSLRDRRVNIANPRAHSMTNRRAGGGRRIND